MKKLCAILILTIILTASLFSVGICFATETDVYYRAENNVTLYINETLVGDSFTIPATYFVKIDKDRTFKDKSAAVKYKNDTDTFYINCDDIKNKNLVQYSKAIDEEKYPSSYSISNLTIGDNRPTLTLLAKNNYPLEKSKIKSINFYGFNTIEGKSCYYVKVVDTEFAYPTFSNIYAEETNAPSITLTSVPKHNSATSAEGSAPPQLTNPDGTPKDATTKLVRNILIGVICALSVVVVFLIFKPSKKNKQNRNNNSGDGNYPNNNNYPNYY